jgi:succinate dehydrogenase/fumarate reductase flavoprotein subunit
MEVWSAGNIVFALGGPGGLYYTSVYPVVHTGGIGIALDAGAEAVNLTESQFGLASVKHRWNVSGSYQQVIPRYFSTDQDGNNPEEFLNPWFETIGSLADRIFLKGYQWPFDVNRITPNGSSLLDILVYHETEIKGRRVFLDFRENPRGDERIGYFDLSLLGPESHDYLSRSNALQETPFKRLEKMNPLAVKQYRDHHIDLENEPLEIAVCAQHNNGGLSVDVWWESTNIAHLFPVGEIAGTHGVYRPGGAALNAGQVGAIRAAMKIASEYGDPEERTELDMGMAGDCCSEIFNTIEMLTSCGSGESVSAYLHKLQHRMSHEAAHVRNPKTLPEALEAALDQIFRYRDLRCKTVAELPRALKVRQLAVAHAAYLSAINYYVQDCMGGSRGSSIILDGEGQEVHPRFNTGYRFRQENKELRDYLIITKKSEDYRFVTTLIDRRPVPQQDFWFEKVWEEFRDGSVYKTGEQGV